MDRPTACAMILFLILSGFSQYEPDRTTEVPLDISWRGCADKIGNCIFTYENRTVFIAVTTYDKCMEEGWSHYGKCNWSVQFTEQNTILKIEETS